MCHRKKKLSQPPPKGRKVSWGHRVNSRKNSPGKKSLVTDRADENLSPAGKENPTTLKGGELSFSIGGPSYRGGKGKGN